MHHTAPIACLLIVASSLISCAHPEIPRSTALRITGEIVATQRLEREKSAANANEPDLIVDQILPVCGRPDLAIAVCRYSGISQGYALLIEHRTFPPKTLATFGGDQYQQVHNVTTQPHPDGTLIKVSHVTGHGNNAGTDIVLIAPGNSVHWIENAHTP